MNLEEYKYKIELGNQQDSFSIENLIEQATRTERERCASIVKSYSSIVGSFIDPINILVKTLINEIEKSIRDQG